MLSKENFQMSLIVYSMICFDLIKNNFVTDGFNTRFFI